MRKLLRILSDLPATIGYSLLLSLLIILALIVGRVPILYWPAAARYLLAEAFNGDD